ncbi:MAG TPA: hypothetical protein VLH56_14470 [Dissulfurispiraceae bacterium]|nr:hypothetical protein [Dissulfurispiraceae bacterium]
MMLEINIDGASETMQIPDAYRPDLPAISAQIEQLANRKGIGLASLDMSGLIRAMIKGIAGCERGCPADAKGLTARGYDGFELNYVEGGILTARSVVGSGTRLTVKMFPDF